MTPFAWSQPHDLNDDVAGVAEGLRALGHEVTVLAPSTGGAELLAGRRALQRGEREDVIAVGPAVPVSRRSQLACRSACSEPPPGARTEPLRLQVVGVVDARHVLGRDGLVVYRRSPVVD